ncbi:MAG TPA: MBL fold metallo-hydrolase [Steroidobacteraceae bacterium]|jgi:glyoxylase-like metal-dependent hydrolase (beta-lactamase superfamily II)|nr:MBL fold metallo-hydrolase [Steroidobacteraceae bacterium]
MSGSLPRLTKFADGITAVDTEYVRPQMDAAHVVTVGSRAAIVDTGPNSAVPRVLAALAELGIERDAVDYLFLTHVHLDHAGGAGALMRELPRATAVIHPRGAPHMIDPSKLIAGTRAVYGDEAYARLYGDILPIARERLVIAQDGQRFELAGRVFECVHTPGHALHHQAIVDHGATSIFTGDTFGLSYREFDTAKGPWISPTTTPTQFDPAQLKASIVRLMQYRPRRLYLTHYSEVGDCARLANDMYDAIDGFVRIARASGLDARRIRFELRAWAHDSLREHGVTLGAEAIDAVLDKDFELNAAGLVAWLRREAN